MYKDAHLWLKAEIKAAVGFIDDEEGAASKVTRTRLHEIDQTPRCSDCDFSPILQLLRLWVLGQAPKRRAAPQPVRL